MKNYQKVSLIFLEDLKKKALRVSGNESENIKTLLNDVINIIKNKESVKETTLVDYTYSLTTLIEKIPINDYERMRLFFDIMRSNLKLLKATNDPIIIPQNLKDSANRNNVSLSSLLPSLKLEKREAFKQAVHSWLKDLSDEELENLYYECRSFDTLKKNYQILKENYYDKKGFPTKDEFLEIKKVLNSFSLPKEFREMLNRELEMVIQNEETKDSLGLENAVECPGNLNEGEKGEKSIVSPKKILTKKEWYQLNMEANRYYNLDANHEIRDLTPLEKIELIIILKKLNYSEKEIDKILQRLNICFANGNLNLNMNQAVKNAFILLSIYKKLQYYKMETDILNIQELIEMIKETTDGKERNAWKRELWNQFNDIYKKLPLDNQFEKQQVENYFNRVKKRTKMNAE